jgi:hypothetical protein
MNSSHTTKATERFKQSYNGRLGIKMYDVDNLYPNNILLKVADSPTASGCLERYTAFIEGNGLHSSLLANAEVNRNGQALDEVHALLSADLAAFGGFAALVQYDIYCRPCGIEHIPFEQCRLEECDADGNVAHIAVHSDWSGQKTRDGERLSVSEDNIDYINVFNPDPAVVAEQILGAGGITSYTGQVYYYSNAGYMVYPKPRYDSAITDISTDTGISNVMNRNVRSNFFAAGIVSYFANVNEGEEDVIRERLETLQGDMQLGTMIALPIQDPNERPEFTEFKGHNFDKDFTATTSATAERIYSAFGQEGWYCLRIGKTGFSGTLVKDIETEYSRRCKKDQRALTKAYYAILSRFAEGVLPEVPTLEGLTIEPYSSITTTTTTL